MTVVKIALIGIAGILVGFKGYRQYESSQMTQPYEFNHSVHTIMACVRCHEGAVDGVRATLPPIKTCLKCHATSPRTEPSEIAVWNDAVKRGGFKWNKLTFVPDHVHFSHSRHTKFGKIQCESCHGDMKYATAPPSLPLVRIRMGLCIDCHRERGESDDCVRCHK